MSEHRVNVDNGKYTFVVLDGFKIHVWRGGKPWIEHADAPKAIHCLIAELDAARVVLQAARALAAFFETMPLELATMLARHDEPVAIVRALARHGGLVDDREPPSAWTVTS